MTLKEKIQDIQITECMAETLEYIADDYAIEFAEWCILNYNFINKEHFPILLKEFKKQKGL
jgi:hypothetical protein